MNFVCYSWNIFNLKSFWKINVLAFGRAKYFVTRAQHIILSSHKFLITLLRNDKHNFGLLNNLNNQSAISNSFFVAKPFNIWNFGPNLNQFKNGKLLKFKIDYPLSEFRPQRWSVDISDKNPFRSRPAFRKSVLEIWMI